MILEAFIGEFHSDIHTVYALLLLLLLRSLSRPLVHPSTFRVLPNLSQSIASGHPSTSTVSAVSLCPCHLQHFPRSMLSPFQFASLDVQSVSASSSLSHPLLVPAFLPGFLSLYSIRTHSSSSPSM